MAPGQPQRILMTADAVGGVWTYAIELCRVLQRRGAQVLLATMGPLPDERQRREAASLANVTLKSSPLKLEWMDYPWDEVARAGEWLLGLEEEFHPDLIHLNGYVHGSLHWHAPVVIVAHSCVLSWWRAVKGEDAPPRYDHYRAAVAYGLVSADAVVAPTHSMRHCLEAHYGKAVQNVRVVPNAREHSRFIAAAKAEKILAAGRLWDEAKNIAALQAVAGQVKWPIEVAGDGEGGALRHLGRLSETEMADALSRAAIYALPARYEPFGLSVLEAALSGCALVLGDIDSLRENWSGAAVFVPPDDHDALAAALNRLIDDPARRQSLAKIARDRAAAFSPERMLDGYLAVYCDVLSDVRAPAVAPALLEPQIEQPIAAAAASAGKALFPDGR